MSLKQKFKGQVPPAPALPTSPGARYSSFSNFRRAARRSGERFCAVRRVPISRNAGDSCTWIGARATAANPAIFELLK